MLLPTTAPALLPATALRPLLHAMPPTMMAEAEPETMGSSKEVLTVALPILGACLAEPVLSMIDTACIGRLSGRGAVTRLAALNVNVAIFNMIACCTSFLCTATTAAVGRARADELIVDGESAAARSLRDGLLISTSLGTILMVFTISCHRAILAQGFGLSPLSETWLPAKRYLQIRALSLPFVAATLVAVGVSLGLQDSMTPLLGVVLAFAVNVVGDVALVWRCNLGLTGAAIATAAASVASSLLIGGALIRKLKPNWRRRVALTDLLPFIMCSGALFGGTALNALTYTGTSRVVAAAGTAASVTQAAAHQIGLQGWWLLSFASVPLSLAGQSLLPQRAKQQPEVAKSTIGVLVRLGVVCAVLMAATNALLTTRLATLFTADPSILTPLRSLTAVAVASQALVSLATALDGIFIGVGWLGHYVAACLLGTGAAVGFFAAGLRSGGGLVPAWRGLLAFSAVRAIAHVVQLPRLVRSLGAEDASESAD